MNLEEAIKTAIDMEIAIRDAYYSASAASPSEEGKRIFKLLGDEEEGHVQYLTVKLDEWLEKGQITEEELKTILPRAEEVRAMVDTMRDKLDAKVQKRDVESMEKALTMEMATSSFYAKMVAELDETGKTLFKRFLEIEEGHMLIVQTELDSMNGLGFWFDAPEFDLEMG